MFFNDPNLYSVNFRENLGTTPGLCGSTVNRFFNTYPTYPTYPPVVPQFTGQMFPPQHLAQPYLPQYTTPQFVPQYATPQFVPPYPVPQYLPQFVPQYATPQFIPQFPTIPPVNPMMHTPFTPFNWTLPLFNAYRPIV